MRIFLFLFFVTSLGFSQNNPIDSSVLAPGQALTFEDRQLKFKEVISDSRCPKGTTCIRAGEAKVLVEVFKNGKLIKEKVISVVGGTNIPTDILSVEALYISKLRLTPYPEISGKIAASDYKLYVEVSEAKVL